MKPLSQRPRPGSFYVLVGMAVFGTISLIGCGLGGSTSSSSAISPVSSVPAQKGSGVGGILHGGPNPITGANVILWATQSSGYPSLSNDTVGTTSLQLATTTTDGTGHFQFTPGSYTCPTGQFAYITATGGNAGAGSNNQIVLMSALGSCSHFDNATDENNIQIFVSEATTVVAAYALGNFMYVDDKGGTGNQLVYVSAPVNNNAAAGSCTGVGASMSCTAAGLAHAFANAANLVDAVHYDGSSPTGVAYTAPPSNTTYGTAPAAEINVLANILQACTNSKNGSGGAISMPCSSFFALATPASSTNGVGSGGGTAPVDGLQALMDIAKSPSHNVTSLFNLDAPTSYFQPALTVAPNDWSLAIAYAPATTGSTLSSAIAITAYSITSNVITFTAPNALVKGQQVFVYGFPNSTFLNGVAYVVSSTGLSTSQFEANFTYANTSGTVTESGSALYDYPVYLALDANDNVYVASQDGTNLEGGVSALASDGAPNWTNALSSSTCEPFMVATDVNSNVWLSSEQSSSGCGSSAKYLIGFSDTSGATTSSALAAESGTAAIAFDRSSDLWLYRNEGCASGGTACIYYYKYSSGSGYTTAIAKINDSEDADLAYTSGLFIDSNYNVWMTNLSSSATTAAYLSVLPNSGSVSSPAWADNVISEALPAGKNFGVAMDGSNNLWAGSDTGTTADLSEFTPTYSSTAPATVTAISSPANTSIAGTSVPSQGEFDGSGTYWYPSNASTGSIYYYVPSTQTNLAIQPCFLPGSAITCGSNTAISTGGGRVVQVDSAGSIWVAATTGGQVVQIIGTAAPTWPQLSYAAFAAMPH